VATRARGSATEQRAPVGQAAGLERAFEAAAAGRFAAALEIVEEALASCDDPDLRLIAGQLSYAADRAEWGRGQLEAAVADYEARGLRRKAAVAACALGCLYESGLGNLLAARAWRARARRYLEGEGRCVEQGWVALGWTGCGSDDPEALLRDAELALGLAREFGDHRLEVRALADGGLALVGLGRVTEGMGWLDEAMALLRGPALDLTTRGQVCCVMVHACDRTGDVGRLDEWSHTMHELGVIGETAPILLVDADCDVAYGRVLCQLGRWTEADDALRRGVERAEASGSAYHVCRAVSALAELRVRQGRLDEAEALLLGLEDRAGTVIPLAQLNLARGEYDLAAAAARRGLRMRKADVARRAELEAILVDAELGRGNVAGAAEVASELGRRALGAELPAVAAGAAMARARVAAAQDDRTTAIELLEHGLEHLSNTEHPCLRAALHLELARLRAPEDRAGAAIDARAAAAIHARIETPAPAGLEELLRPLGVRSSGSSEQARSHAASLRASLTRENGRWIVSSGEQRACLKDSKGMRYLHELVVHAGVDRHVLDLVAAAEGRGMCQHGAWLGDAGELLDDAAKTAYRRRIEELREEREDAELVGNEDRAWELQAELDALIGELARGLGLGGRHRRAGSVAERARVNVTRAIRTAIGRIEEVLPELGRHLDRSVQTGYYCRYEPPAGEVVALAAEVFTPR
jgi:tetratricopeptide (TPR) repeat protein